MLKRFAEVWDLKKTGQLQLFDEKLRALALEFFDGDFYLIWDTCREASELRQAAGYVGVPP